VKHNGLGGWALLALVCVGVTLVVARRFHDGDAPAPVPAPVAEVADSPVVGAPPAVAPSHGAAPVFDVEHRPSARRRAALLALELKLQREQGTDAEYARYVGVSLRPGQTFAEYIADLETRIARGDTAAMVEMAKTLNSCWYARSHAEDAVAFKREADEDYDRKLQTDRLCESTLDLSDQDQVRNRQAELIVDAARRGNEAAILAQLINTPHWVAVEPQSERSQAWVNEAAGRLEALASTGNSTAALRLGDLYRSQQDYPKAAAYFRQVLDSQPMRKEEAHARALMPGPDSGRYHEIYFESLLAEGELNQICGKIPPGSVAPGVCK